MSLSSEVRALKDQLEQEKTLLKESQEKVYGSYM